MKNKTIIYSLSLIFVLSVTNISAQQKHYVLKLKDAIQIALSNNPADKIAQSKIKEAEGKIIQAHSLYVPKLDLLGKYFYTNNLPNFFPQQMKQVPVMSSTGPVPGEFVPLRPLSPFPSNNRDVFTMDLNLVYPLYTGGKITKANKNAKILKSLFESNRMQTDADIVHKVKKAFYNILFLNDVIGVNQKVIKQLEEHLQLAKKAYDEGVRSEFEVISFEAKIDEFKSKLVDLKGKLQIATTGLKNLLNLPLVDSLECDGELNISGEFNNINEPEQLEEILNENHQLQMLKKKEGLLGNLAVINEAGNKPTLFAFANYHLYHGKDFPPYDDSWRNGWAAGLGISMKIFDGSFTNGKVQEAKASIEEVKNKEEGLILKLRFQVKSINENIASLKSQLEAFNKTLMVANKGYEIAKVSYKNGVITNVQLDDAQLNVLRNETRILQIKKELLIEKANLDFIKGVIN